MRSIWQKTVEMPEFPALEGEHTTDVAIIGGGIAGILTAFFLRKCGIGCMVLEKERICGGTTAGTTAKITVQHGLIYEKMLRKNGVEIAAGYLEANREALKEWKRAADKIDCEFEVQDSFLYSTDRRDKLERELRALERIGGRAVFCETTELPMRTAGAVKMTGQAQFHPLKWVAAVAPGLPIYEHSKVLESKKNELVLENGTVRADKIIVATHFPMLNKHGAYFLKLYQNRSYVLALRDAQNLNGMYRDEKETGMSFRMYQDILLLGGGSHRTGKKSTAWDGLRQFSREKYPLATEVCHWAAQDCMSLDERPYIGPYSKNTPGLYVASGFQKWGMTGAMLSAMLLTDLILEKKNAYRELFCPYRPMRFSRLCVNGLEAAKNLLTISPKRCPHLGCALKWNTAEHSWDCACHGSRFDKDGTVLNNPANGNLKVGRY